MEVVNTLKSEMDRTGDTRFEHTMIISKDQRNEEILAYRHKEECKLLTDLIKKKKDE